MLTSIFDFACNISPYVRRFVVRMMYQGLSALDTEGCMVFMNYGYADLTRNAVEIKLQERDEVNRYCTQLYRHVIGSIDLKGLDVLEVGSGRGGGASYIRRYLQPKSMTGIDIAAKAIAFCKRYHATKGLCFIQGDAEALPFEDATFDVIVNIESSHCYGNIERFFSEVHRVLRPGGYFLFADHRHNDKIATLRKQLVESHLACLKEQKISLNILRALELDNGRKLSLIRQKAPWIAHRSFQAFAAMRGTEMYENFRTGVYDYWSFVLHKKREAVS
ncbi:MAG: class I SAM-dependent methyltransferase [Chloroflexi bacterium]|nr:class I SAM-dependent methyltransferase [Ktedonobacteraceae bacterium]MBV9020369.1 class I SAM-dependent methyltransferase [Ktedonobacteraceae bacterium]MBV9706246.1 class I SAM-dependent methyltransferase [Chloroflexota bacterium]